MPQYVETPPEPNVDLHASPATTQGTGTYQVGTAPKTLKQKQQEAVQSQMQRSAAGASQKVKSYVPDPKSKGRTSFSDEQGD